MGSCCRSQAAYRVDRQCQVYTCTDCQIEPFVASLREDGHPVLVVSPRLVHRQHMWELVADFAAARQLPFTVRDGHRLLENWHRPDLRLYVTTDQYRLIVYEAWT